jgi:hypothetical protein
MNWQKKNRKKAIVYSKGYVHGARNERERIISDLLKDAVIITNLDVEILERVVEIVEG